MQGKVHSLGDVFTGSNHFSIPAYQRPYQWDASLWQALVSDVSQIDVRKKAPKHWMGILLVSEEPLQEFGKNVFKVIDGQQRSVTIRLWLAALEHHLQENFGKSHSRLGKKKVARIDVQESDSKAFQLAIEGKWREPEAFEYFDSRVFQAYIYFRFMLWLGKDFLDEEEPHFKPKRFKKQNSVLSFEKQWETQVESKFPAATQSEIADTKTINQLVVSSLDQLTLFMVRHEKEKDEPEAVIFDTLNGMRMELAPLDHVRTYVFVRVEDFEEDTLYKKYWEPAERRLREIGNQGYKSETAFVYDYLIAMGESESQGTIKTAKGGSHFATMLNKLNLSSSSEYAEFIKNEVVPYMQAWPVVARAQDHVNTPDKLVNFSVEALNSMSNIRDMSQGPANPLVLHYLVGFVKGRISDTKQLEKCLHLIENFVARQFLGGKALSPLRRTLMTVMAKVAKTYSEDDLKSALLAAGWVKDKEILEVIETRDWSDIKTTAIAAILRGAERQISGPAYKFFQHGNQPGLFSLEHIYPRTPNKWRNDFKVWNVEQKSMDDLRETLGNYAFVTPEHNSKVGNSEFAKKLTTGRMENLSPDLGINKSWVKKQKWTPSDVRSRSKYLAEKALLYWPDLSSDN